MPLDTSALLAIERDLQRWLPADAILIQEESRRPYESDGLAIYHQLPGLVVLPSCESEIQAVTRYCRDKGLPLVVRGAGTGLSGGALPSQDGVLMSLARMMAILEIDPAACTARVQPGVRNLAVSEAAAPYGLYYAPDPSSQVICSIGGNVAENSGGVHCLKYGMTRQNLLKVRLVTVQGEVVEIGSEAGEAPGYDLLSLVTGSEGLLGVVTEITLKLLPKAPCSKALIASFSDVESAARGVASILAAGIIPAGLEMMDGLATRAAEAFARVGYPVDAEALLICESDGSPEAVTIEIDRMREILEASGSVEIRESRDEAERLKFWAGRKGAFPAVGRLAPDYYCIDGTIPRRHLGHVLKRIGEMSQEVGLEVANVFHAGDGNLHPLILFDAAQPGAIKKTEALGTRILELCVEMGGTITGEHGVGVEKLDPMCLQFGDAEREIFHGIKAAFDPSGLLNPGKAIPTLHRCAELGRMHVHHNQLNHPEIPRF